MTVENQAPARTRRALLGAALGAVAASTVSALGRPFRAEAANGEFLTVGQTKTGTLTTGLSLSAQGQALRVSSNVGVSDNVGIVAEAANDRAIALRAVVGKAPASPRAVQGTVTSSSGYGIVGRNQGLGTGIGGYSVDGETDIGAPKPKTGVYGRAEFDANSRGVFGTSTTGHGVHGEASSGVGVFAMAASAGTALQVQGRAKFSRSGIVGIPSGASSAVKTSVPLSSSSLVLAVLQQEAAGVWIRAVVPNPAASSFTVYLNKNAPITLRAAYFVIG